MKVKLLSSKCIDESIDCFSCGGGLEFNELTTDLSNFITNVESGILTVGGIFYRKIFVHSYNENNVNFNIYIKKPPKLGQIFILYHKDLTNPEKLDYTFPDVVYTFQGEENSTYLRLFTHFQLYESKINRETNKLKLKCPWSIPFQNTHLTAEMTEQLVPSEWFKLLWKYLPKFIDVGDKIKIFKLTYDGISNEVFESRISNINLFVNCNDKYYNSLLVETFFEIELEDAIPIGINLYKENTVVSNIFDLYNEIQQYLNHGFINFTRVISDRGNYSIENYPIETNLYGTVYEKWRILFTSDENFKLIALNNNIVIKEGNINEDLEPINEFLSYGGLTYPFFKLRKDGWIGEFREGDTFEFITYGKEFPLWILLYYPMNIPNPDTLLTNDSFQIEIEEA